MVKRKKKYVFTKARRIALKKAQKARKNKIRDYKVTSRKPKGYGTTRDGYRSDSTGKYYTWKKRK